MEIESKNRQEVLRWKQIEKLASLDNKKIAKIGQALQLQLYGHSEETAESNRRENMNEMRFVYS